MQAPAGSGKTDLLTRRFLRLLAEVDEPGEVVAITFTIAAAAEMRHRILDAMEDAAKREDSATSDEEEPFSMPDLARKALDRSRARGWELLRSPSQLRISTIDSFCRELALQKPLLSGLGGGISIHENPADLYRRAARRTLEEIDNAGVDLASSIAALLAWRDNNWQALEDMLVEMLGKRDRWMHDFVLDREPDWVALRARLERPFANAIRECLANLIDLFNNVDGACDEAMWLARFACEQTSGRLHRDLAEMDAFPRGPHTTASELEDAIRAHLCLADLILTKDGRFRSSPNKTIGFPSDRKIEKNRMIALIGALGAVPSLDSALCDVRSLPSPRYSEEEWQIVRACFTVLRHAAAELRVVFAEAGSADFIEVAQIAQNVLASEDGLPSDAAQSIADGIRHLLVDEFQDTSRRQHELLRRIVAAWPQREGRTVFAVGDPMQSIYFFRDADTELFPRVRELGLEMHDGPPLALESVQLTANFRTEPALVEQLNKSFANIFATPDGSGIAFAPAAPARAASDDPGSGLALHVDFVRQAARGQHSNPLDDASMDAARQRQTGELVDLIRTHITQVEAKRLRGEKHRIAVLGRSRKVLALIAAALRNAAIPFRAVDLEPLAERPEILDALTLSRALLNPEDRVAWLGVLRAPWCALALDDLHKLVSDDSSELLSQPIPAVLADRLPLLSRDGKFAAARVLAATGAAPEIRDRLNNAALGTFLEQVWLSLGGADCVDATGRANLELLWKLLDNLPGGEQDLLSGALDAALEKLTAMPDPESSGDHGVQLMTIHKAKGLEFEVVIVPGLEAGSGKADQSLLSWLERGVPPEQNHEESGQITEFLVAPVQSKGADRGAVKKWVDRIRSEREAQEVRRLLYVAATRARQELHLFAKLQYKTANSGAPELINPSKSLLATAWPALGEDILSKFDAWKNTIEDPANEPDTVEAIAAAAQLFVVQAPTPSTRLRRLPRDYKPKHAEAHLPAHSPMSSAADAIRSQPYERHEGGLASRAFGVAVHHCFDELARLTAAAHEETAHDALAQSAPRIAAQIRAQVRALGIDAMTAAEIAANAIETVRKASLDATCRWILAPHADASSEVRWVGMFDGVLRNVQVDRVFRAGAQPLLDGDNTWWIIDYKTYNATSETDASTLLPKLRELFAPPARSLCNCATQFARHDFSHEKHPNPRRHLLSTRASLRLVGNLNPSPVKRVSFRASACRAPERALAVPHARRVRPSDSYDGAHPRPVPRRSHPRRYWWRGRPHAPGCGKSSAH